MKFVKWWLNELFIPGICLVISIWIIAMLLKILNYLYQLI